jgi:hypothetical protein
LLDVPPADREAALELAADEASKNPVTGKAKLTAPIIRKAVKDLGYSKPKVIHDGPAPEDPNDDREVVEGISSADQDYEELSDEPEKPAFVAPKRPARRDVYKDCGEQTLEEKILASWESWLLNAIVTFDLEEDEIAEVIFKRLEYQVGGKCKR